MKLTEKQSKVMEILKQAKESGQVKYLGPTKIGLLAGIDYGSASSWCNSALKRLVEMNMVKRHDDATYEFISY